MKRRKMGLIFHRKIPSKEEMRAAINKFFVPYAGRKKPRGKDEFQVTWEAGEKLERYGSFTVAPILDVLERRHQDGTLDANPHGLPMSILIALACKYALSEHASRLASMLLWDEFMETKLIPYRYVGYIILSAHYVQEYALKVDQMMVSGQKVDGDIDPVAHLCTRQMTDRVIEAMKIGGVPKN